MKVFERFERTEVERDNLVVGDEYFDTGGCLGEKMVYVGIFENKRHFYPMDWCHGYTKEEDGCIVFCENGRCFYEEV